MVLIPRPLPLLSQEISSPLANWPHTPSYLLKCMPYTPPQTPRPEHRTLGAGEWHTSTVSWLTSIGALAQVSVDLDLRSAYRQLAVRPTGPQPDPLPSFTPFQYIQRPFAVPPNSRFGEFLGRLSELPPLIPFSEVLGGTSDNWVEPPPPYSAERLPPYSVGLPPPHFFEPPPPYPSGSSSASC